MIVIKITCAGVLSSDGDGLSEMDVADAVE